MTETPTLPQDLLASYPAEVQHEMILHWAHKNFERPSPAYRARVTKQVPDLPRRLRERGVRTVHYHCLATGRDLRDLREPTPQNDLQARWDALRADPTRFRLLLGLVQAGSPAWVITRDHLWTDPGDTSREGKTWVSRFGFTRVVPTPHTVRVLAEALPLQFRLLDDDGELYYTGRCTGPIAAEHALEWAMADAGAVRVDTRKGNGPWETLIS
jgi:hypothetical protein